MKGWDSGILLRVYNRVIVQTRIRNKSYNPEL